MITISLKCLIRICIDRYTGLELKILCESSLLIVCICICKFYLIVPIFFCLSGKISFCIYCLLILVQKNFFLFSLLCLVCHTYLTEINLSGKSNSDNLKVDFHKLCSILVLEIYSNICIVASIIALCKCTFIQIWPCITLSVCPSICQLYDSLQLDIASILIKCRIIISTDSNSCLHTEIRLYLTVCIICISIYYCRFFVSPVLSVKSRKIYNC